MARNLMQVTHVRPPQAPLIKVATGFGRRVRRVGVPFRKAQGMVWDRSSSFLPSVPVSLPKVLYMVKLIVHSQAAIVRGAAMRGLVGISPRKRRCRRHYGFKISKPFREGIDPIANLHVDRFDGRRLCSNKMLWITQKVSGKRFGLHRLELTCCRAIRLLKTPPGHTQSDLPSASTIRTQCWTYSCTAAV
jgi:hypothetical protein